MSAVNSINCPSAISLTWYSKTPTLSPVPSVKQNVS
jgi:hypothetical protein